MTESNTAETELDFFPFRKDVVLPHRSLDGTGPKGLNRDDRLVADADNKRVRQGKRPPNPRRKVR